tara:strand:- start:703 stop:930 length:228 start_codon:yes stop_codon:yes gene_type:complete
MEYTLFVDIGEAERRGIDLDDIVGPEIMWGNGKLCVTLGRPTNEQARKEQESKQEFRQYADHPDSYKQIDISIPD